MYAEGSHNSTFKVTRGGSGTIKWDANLRMITPSHFTRVGTTRKLM